MIREGALLHIKHLALFVLLVVVLGSILSVSSCTSLQRDPTPTPSSEHGGQIPGETAVEDQSNDLSYLIESDPAVVDNSNLPVTPIEDLHLTGEAPEVDIAQYRLIIDGLVETELSLTYDTLLEYPTVTGVVLLICPFIFADNAEWTGIPVTTLLAEVGIKPQATHLVFYSFDGHYKKTLLLEDIQHDGVFLAHTVNGQVLPVEHGFPLRLVVQGDYGNMWVKWVDRIEVK